jgi:ABC-type multidrug transport system fused ATPase/permease subunit
MPENNALQLDDHLFALFDKLVPLVDNVADAMRTTTLLGLLIIGWLFVWMFFLQSFSLTTSLVLLTIIAIPILILFRFWWALESLKDLPEIAQEMMDDVTDEAKETWRSVRSDKKKALNVLGQAKNMWEMKSLLGELDDVFAQYINIGTLVNPFSLILGIISLLSILLLGLIGVVLLLGTLF